MSTSLAQYEIPGIPAPQAKEQEVTALSILHGAVQSGASIDTIERLVALQEKMLARQAEIDFNEALNAAQSEIGRIAPNLTNPQTKSKYASYDALDRVVRPVYVRQGFSLSFTESDSPKPEHIRILCLVSRGAHTRTYQKDMPADGKGAKGGDVMTKTHAAAAADSYAKRYLLKDIFNIAIGEDDSDGNVGPQRAGGPKYTDLNERIEWIENCKSLPELEKVYKAAYQEAFVADDHEALKSLRLAKDRRKQELQ